RDARVRGDVSRRDEIAAAGPSLALELRHLQRSGRSPLLPRLLGVESVDVMREDHDGVLGAGYRMRDDEVTVRRFPKRLAQKEAREVAAGLEAVHVASSGVRGVKVVPERVNSAAADRSP